jgi:peptidoglycan/xylan/chitin deacetylase (PgdA/CDA1 family)
MRELNRRGWEIGLHPSWHSYNSVDEMKYQKEQIEKVLDCEIVSVRQHYLHFDNRITPLIQEAAGFKYDSTLGFNDNIGFRRGTSYAYPLYNIEDNKILPVWELPLIIQDGAMFNDRKGMRLDKVKALEYIQMIAEKVKEVGGILTLLWHPHLIVDEISWNTFQEGLKMLQKDDPWFASVREIGDWWGNNVKIDLVSFIENLEK